MTTIVAARFETETEAGRAFDRLRQAGFRQGNLANFYVTPPGQHGIYPLGGDAAHDLGTRKSGLGAMWGAAIGAIVLGVGGYLVFGATINGAATSTAVGTLVAAGIGGYVGSLVGAMRETRRPDPRRATSAEPVSRKAGPLVAASIDGPEQYAAARDTFIALDAFEIEEAEGTIRGGDWVDFDPRLPPKLIATTHRSAAANTIAKPHVH